MKHFFLPLLLMLGMASPVQAQFSRINSVTLQNSNGTQAAFYASPFTIKVGANCTWSVTGTIATMNCAGGGGGMPAGMDTEIQYNDMGAFGASPNFTFSAAANLLTVAGGMAQATTLVDVHNNSTSTCQGMTCVRGAGAGVGAFGPSVFDISGNDDEQVLLTLSTDGLPDSRLACYFASVTFYCGNYDGTDTGTFGLTAKPFGGSFVTGRYDTVVNCVDAAGAAACGDASSGVVVIDAAATTVVVSTTVVTAKSRIFVMENPAAVDDLGIMDCNVTFARVYAITEINAGMNFTITASTAPTVTPACLNFWVVN